MTVGRYSLARRPPQLPADVPRIEYIDAHLGHAALYILPAALLALGWASTNLGGHTLHLLGFAMPKIFPTVESEALDALI